MNVGDYVRTKEGKIAKCISHEDKTYKFDGYIDTYYDDEYIDYIYDEELAEWKEYYNVKFFTNIIDLIETGDYVNGEKVITVGSYFVNTENNTINKWDFKSIVTKEQFEDMEYRVGE